jgi:hypothetical protein
MEPEQDLNPNDNRAHLIYIPVGIFGVICPVLVGLRLWSRLRKNSRLGSDDYTCIAALVSLKALDRLDDDFENS